MYRKKQLGERRVDLEFGGTWKRGGGSGQLQSLGKSPPEEMEPGEERAAMDSGKEALKRRRITSGEHQGKAT